MQLSQLGVKNVMKKGENEKREEEKAEELH